MFKAALRAILVGWAALIPIAFVVERPLLMWVVPLFGGTWFPTARLALDCLTLAATGWITGRLNHSRPVFAILVFAATLSVWDFGPVLPVDVPWLVRLIRDTLADTRYFDSLVTALTTHALLFGSLIAGGLLSRDRQGALPRWIKLN